MDRYGADHFAHIGIFGIAKAKGIFKDVCRIHEVDFAKSNELSKLIPDMCESLSDALEDSIDFKKAYDSDPHVKEIVDYAMQLEGCIKSVGVHACLSWDTFLTTRDGPCQISKLLYRELEILTPNGWKFATIICNGYKNVATYIIKSDAVSYIIRTTPDHKILTSDGYVDIENATNCFHVSGQHFSISRDFDTPLTQELVFDFIIDSNKEEERCGYANSIIVHNCGVALSGDIPMTDIVPLFESQGVPVTQFDGPTLEKIGLIKYDILGLKNLTVISKTLKLIEKIHGTRLTAEEIPIDDLKAFKLISDNNSLGVFQIEGSKALRDFAAAAKPKSIQDISAIISLYRPGPMGMGALDMYLARKNGNESRTFKIPEYDYIFKDTYGLLIYQEQLIRLAADMCGFNDIETDTLRKAVGKKDRELLLQQKEKFVNGAVKNGQDRNVISALFDEMEEFARYCFNLSHAICYAEIGCKTAWLKTYYPSEYMAALISCEPDPDQQAIYIEDARRNNIDVLPPDLNKSLKDFTVGDNGEILFGFNCIKGVGGKAVDTILSLVPFTSMSDFLIRTYHAKGVNKKIYEALIKCGACDAFGYKRSGLLSAFEAFLVDYSAVAKDGYTSENAKLFLEKEYEYFESNELSEFPLLTILEHEKTLLGIYISGNPFDVIIQSCKLDFDYRPISYWETRDTNLGYILGQIVNFKKTLTKNKQQMAFLNIMDHKGSFVNMIIFPNSYDAFSEYLVEGKYALIGFKSKTDSKGKTYLLNSIRDLTNEIDAVSAKVEADKSMKSVDIHLIDIPGSVRFRTLQSKIMEYVVDEPSDYQMTLCLDIGNTVFRLNKYNCKQISIAMLRDLGRLQEVYVSRGV